MIRDSKKPSGKRGLNKEDNLIDKKKKKVALTYILQEPGEKVKVEALDYDHPLLKSLAELYVQDWKQSHTRDKQNRSYFYTSDAGKCPRGIIYAFTVGGKKGDMKAGTIMMFTMGNLFHEELQSMYRRLGATVNQFVEYGTLQRRGGWEKSGRLDLFLKEGASGNLVAMAVGEIKSKNPYAYDAEEPPQDEIDQLLTYISDTKSSEYLKTRGKAVCDYGYIIYADRAGFGQPIPVKAWIVYYSDKRIEQINRFFDDLWDAIQKGILPPRPYERNSIPCTYCRFQGWCWKGVPKIEEPKFEPDAEAIAPEAEIVESAALAFLKNDLIEKEAKKEKEFARKILEKHYLATGVPEIPVGEEKVQFVYSASRVLKHEYLWKKCSKIWNKIAKVQISMLKEAVAAGLVDGGTFERAFEAGKPSVSIRAIRKKKKED